MNNQDVFSGMTALVTGASSGIGAAAAWALGSRGARILAHYHSQEQAAREVIARLREAGIDAEVLRADLATMDGVRGLSAELKDRPVDILVNNAGSLVRWTRILEFTEALWDQVITLNLSSAFF